MNVPVYPGELGPCVYICPLCGQPGARGSTCDRPLHDPPEQVEMVPSTAVALAYQTYQRGMANPEARSGATIDEMESGQVEPTPAELLRIAATIRQPVHFFFIDHGAPSNAD